MIVKKSSWHYRAYKRWEERKARWMDKYPYLSRGGSDYSRFLEAQENRRLDLCHYMRVVFILGPIRWFIQGYQERQDREILYKKPWLVLVQLVVLGLILAWLITNPVNFALTIGVLVGGIGLGLATIVGGVYTITEVRAPQRAANAVSHSLVGEYVKARKKKICPFIEVEDG
jgi:hypothetical protein